jgi:23S rRNA (uracil1939-C5)-methyltransferase
VELNPQAVKDGIANAKANGVKNVRFVKADATEYMMQAAAAGERFDVVFMDPPRAGSTREFTEALLALAPKRVVYISCNPQTLSRDLQWFGRAYHVEGFYPYDMFPFSGHVECVACLQRVKHIL